MRICYCISHFHPVASGAERQAQRQGAELLRRGHKVMVVTRAVRGLPRREAIAGLDVHRTIRTLNFGPLFGLSFLWSTFRALRKLRSQFDLIHCHQSLWEAAACGRFVQSHRTPSLVQPAASGPYGEFHQWQRTKGRSMLRRWILKNTHFVSISAEIEAELCELGVDRSKLTMIGSGVDTELFSPGEPPPLGLPPGLRVIFVGRLHPQKNLDQFLPVWKGVARETAAHLLLLGDGPDRSKLESLAQQLGIGDQVHFLGSVPNPEDYLRAADVFVLPSVAEGMSNSLLEAMSAGLPVVVSDIGGNRDLVKHARTGLVAEGPDQWNQQLLVLLGDSSRRRQLGVNARGFVEENYSISRVVDQYESLYGQILRRNSLNPHRSAF